MSFTGTEKHQSGRQITAHPIWSVRRMPSVKTAPELQLPELRIHYRSAAGLERWPLMRFFFISKTDYRCHTLLRQDAERHYCCRISTTGPMLAVEEDAYAVGRLNFINLREVLLCR